MSQGKERKIIVAINYDGCDIDEALEIIAEYTDIKKVNTHNLNESKNYIDLRHVDDETWEDIVSNLCGGKHSASGLFFEKYDDWRLCCLPVGWD
ncbi:unnamed protein product [Cunninghamella echinulata]